MNNEEAIIQALTESIDIINESVSDPKEKNKWSGNVRDRILQFIKYVIGKINELIRKIRRTVIDPNGIYFNKNIGINKYYMSSEFTTDLKTLLTKCNTLIDEEERNKDIKNILDNIENAHETYYKKDDKVPSQLVLNINKQLDALIKISKDLGEFTEKLKKMSEKFKSNNDLIIHGNINEFNRVGVKFIEIVNNATTYINNIYSNMSTGKIEKTQNECIAELLIEAAELLCD